MSEPRIAIGVELDTQDLRQSLTSRSREHWASTYLTAIITDHPESEIGPLLVDHAYAGRITALVVLEHEGAPLIVSGGSDRRLRSWRVDGTPGPLHVRFQ